MSTLEGGVLCWDGSGAGLGFFQSVKEGKTRIAWYGHSVDLLPPEYFPKHWQDSSLNPLIWNVFWNLVELLVLAQYFTRHILPCVFFDTLPLFKCQSFLPSDCLAIPISHLLAQVYCCFFKKSLSHLCHNFYLSYFICCQVTWEVSFFAFLTHSEVKHGYHELIC